jgi:hypothetical protein
MNFIEFASSIVRLSLSQVTESSRLKLWNWISKNLPAGAWAIQRQLIEDL